MKQEGEVRYCNIARNVFIKHFNHNYSYIKEKLPLLNVFEPDAIHDIRVTTRRNRALFTEYQHFLPDEIRKKYISENKNITRLLGKRRELDVLLEILYSLIDENPEIFPSHVSESITLFIKKESKKEEKNCIIAKQILERRINGLDSDLELQFSQKGCIYKYGEKEIFKTIKKLQKNYKTIKKVKKPLNEQIHQFRIFLKKTRYKFEIYKEVYDSPITEWLNILKEIQNHLGVWNDYRILLMTIEHIYKEKKEMKCYEFYKIKDYIYNILFTELKKAKKTMGNNINDNFIKRTGEEINKICKSHTCML